MIMMTNTIRVSVTREWRDEAGDYQSETVAEVAGPIALVYTQGPAVIDGALASLVGPGRTDAGDEEEDDRETGEERPSASATEAKPKRKRRTKAEMEADRAREAAEALPLMTQPHDVPVGSVPVVGQDAAPAPNGVQVTTTFEGAAPPAVSQDAGPPAAPYNPFA